PPASSPIISIFSTYGDAIDKDKLDYEPIENARYSSIVYGMYESRAWGTLTTQNSRVYLSMQITHHNPDTLWQSGYTLISIVDNAIKPKFSGTPTNIPLNAVLFAQKVYGYPIDWTGAIPIDCYTNPNVTNLIGGHKFALTQPLAAQLLFRATSQMLIDKFKNKQMEGFNETIIYALDQLNINWHAIFKTIWEAAIKYACESKICR
ncbi:MAG: hypothetical protein EZS28_052475, partial [Streblomastix strix]